MTQTIKNVFLDRDGTIIEDRHYLSDPDGVALIPGAGQGLSRLIQAGMSLFVVSNQSGIGRGMFKPEDYLAVQTRMKEILRNFSVEFSGEAYCPHAPDEKCRCRKPETGMWEDISRKWRLNPGQCAIIGDKAADIEFASNAGFAVKILVLTGHGEKNARSMGLPGLDRAWMELPPGPGRPDVLAKDLAAACDWLLEHNSRAKTKG